MAFPDEKQPNDKTIVSEWIVLSSKLLNTWANSKGSTWRPVIEVATNQQ